MIVGRVLLLVALWLLAWGQITIANFAGGLAVATVLLLVFPPAARAGERTRLNLAGAARFGVYIGAQLVSSNMVMARETLRRRPTISPGVVAHRLRDPSEDVVTLMTSVIALSPGTMTVDVDPGSTTIYVHFLFLHDVNAARAALDRLEQLASAAITAPNARRRPAAASDKESP